MSPTTSGAEMSEWSDLTSCTTADPAQVKPLTFDDLIRACEKLKEIPPPAESLKLGYSLYTRCFTHLRDHKAELLPSFSSLPIKLDYKLEPWACEPGYSPEAELRIQEFRAAALLTGDLP
jgi:hypothetical protein